MTANDISRWCTVWSLLERGTYAIDECPWQVDTQDKVERAPKRRGGAAQDQPEVKHFYSSKPALISTMIAGMLYPARRITGVPLDKVVLQERAERWTQKPDPDHPGKVIGVLETPKEPVKWPAYIFYFKPALIVCNVIPFGLFLILFARLLDRYAANDWAWFFTLVAAAFGTYLLPYTQTLNNHTIGAWSAFFALYHFLRIWDDRMGSGLAVRGGRLLRRVHGGDRVARIVLADVAGGGAAGPLSPADAPVLPAGGARAAGGLRGRPVRRIRRVLHPLRVVRLAGISATRAASGRRRWSSTRSTSTPSRTGSTCST